MDVLKKIEGWIEDNKFETKSELWTADLKSRSFFELLNKKNSRLDSEDRERLNYFLQETELQITALTAQVQLLDRLESIVGHWKNELAEAEVEAATLATEEEVNNLLKLNDSELLEAVAAG